MLHIGDVHLDRPFATSDAEVAFALRRATLNSFSSCIQYCISEDVDFLIISGDLFDGDTVSPKSAVFLLNRIKRLREYGIEVIYATGNHDSSGAMRSSRLFDWPENVTLFDREDHDVTVKFTKSGKSVLFVGIGYETRRYAENAIARLPSRGDFAGKSDYVVGVAHSEVVAYAGAKGKSRVYPYMPCTLDDIKRLEYDYFALGHIHKRQIFKDLQAGYCGSLQSLRTNELGRRGGLSVKIDGMATSVSNIDFSQISFEKIDVDISNAHFSEDIVEMCCLEISVRMRDTYPDFEKLIIECTLSGRCEARSEIISDETVEIMEDEIKSALNVLKIGIDASRVKNSVFADEYMNTDNILGYLIDIADDERKRSDMANKIYDNLKAEYGAGFGAKDKDCVIETLINNRDALARYFVRGSDEK